jgi:hypothetical protein
LRSRVRPSEKKIDSGELTVWGAHAARVLASAARRSLRRFPNFPCNLRPNFRLYISNRNHTKHANNNPASTKKGTTMNRLVHFENLNTNMKQKFFETYS